jgi:hypothetical protein
VLHEGGLAGGAAVVDELQALAEVVGLLVAAVIYANQLESASYT